MKRVITLTFVLVLIINMQVGFCDAGPKPSLTIELKNVEGQSCIVDLLIHDKSSETWEAWTDYEGQYLDNYESIKTYNEDGWRAAQANGLMPISGYPEVVIESGKGMIQYGYYVPDEFKVIVIQESGEILVSNVVERIAFDSHVVFDVVKGSAKEKSPIFQVVSMFIKTYVVTVIIEGMVLWLFGFRSKRNLKVMLTVNAYTQVGLSIALTLSMYIMGIFLALIVFVISEFVIFVVETRMFSRKLEGHTKRRRIVFALCANTASLIIGSYIVAAITL